ncbi:MAG: CBS domain-containing protein [Clostridia bacterium]|nr:CBS domain-containing protein [Clostridia bacterium]
MNRENAVRFIHSYNRIESYLRGRYNVKASQSFTDLVKRCSDLNITIRRYQDVLIDYGKLRNAIVHKDTNDNFIAYPSDEVVARIEKIEKELCSPPPVLQVLNNKKIIYVYADSTIKTAILTFSEYKLRTLPVYDHGKMVGAINVRKLVACIGRAIEEGWDINEYILKKHCEDVISGDDLRAYTFLPKDASIVDCFTAFEKKSILAVFVTETGQIGEKVLTMVTTSDFPLLNKYMELYR